MNKQEEKKYKVETIGVPLFSSLDKKDYDSLLSSLIFSIKEYLIDKDKKPP